MSEAAPTVGVVMPARDARRYIGEAIESVLGQRGVSLRLVVVDDGSADDTAALASSFGERVTVLSQPPRGPAAARNAGIQSLDTRYVGLLDADDVWPPDSVAVRLAALEAQPGVDICFGRMEQFVSPDLPPAERSRLHVPPAREAWSSSAMLARRSVFERVGLLPEHRRAGDFVEWLLRARSSGVEVTMLDDVVHRRRLHLANLTRREPEMNRHYLEVIRAELARRRAAGG